MRSRRIRRWGWGLVRRRAQESQEQLDRTIQERTAQLDALSSHLQDLSEAEKSWLARELHDRLGAILTASRMDLAWVRDKLSPGLAALADKLGRVIQNLEHGAETTRRIVEDLRPTTLITFGLATAVRDYTEQAQRQADWQLELQLPDDDPDLPEDVRIALFRIMQEALANVSKHARASQVRVIFESGHRTAKLEIEDNGIGFLERDLKRETHGLLGMRLRASARGGSLEIRSAPGKGTLVCAILPVRERESPDRGAD